MKDDLQLAKETLITQNLSLALAKDERILGTSRREGIVDLLTFVDELGEELRGGALADKIVGKAVAMVARYAGLVAVYSPLVSQAAVDCLQAGGVHLEYERLVPVIVNKTGVAPCPMEQLTLPLDDPAEAMAALRDFISGRFREGKRH